MAEDDVKKFHDSGTDASGWDNQAITSYQEGWNQEEIENGISEYFLVGENERIIN